MISYIYPLCIMNRAINCAYRKRGERTASIIIIAKLVVETSIKYNHITFAE